MIDADPCTIAVTDGRRMQHRSTAGRVGGSSRATPHASCQRPAASTHLRETVPAIQDESVLVLRAARGGAADGAAVFKGCGPQPGLGPAARHGGVCGRGVGGSQQCEPGSFVVGVHCREVQCTAHARQAGDGGRKHCGPKHGCCSLVAAAVDAVHVLLWLVLWLQAA